MNEIRTRQLFTRMIAEALQPGGQLGHLAKSSFGEEDLAAAPVAASVKISERLAEAFKINTDKAGKITGVGISGGDGTETPNIVIKDLTLRMVCEGKDDVVIGDILRSEGGAWVLSKKPAKTDARRAIDSETSRLVNTKYEANGSTVHTYASGATFSYDKDNNLVMQAFGTKNFRLFYPDGTLSTSEIDGSKRFYDKNGTLRLAIGIL